MTNLERSSSRHRCLLLACDTPEPEVVSRYGDFRTWFGTPLRPVADLVAVDARTSPSPEVLDGMSSVVISGSRHSAYGNEPWLPALEALVRHAVCDRGMSLLGVCFGHQVLAKACGGLVVPNPRGAELGTIEVILNDKGRQDPLFRELGDRFWAQALHTDTVCMVPDGAELLASSSKNACQAFSFGTAWGVQFHPEVRAEMLEGYIRGNATRLRSQNVDPGALLSELRATTSGEQLLQNFVREADRRLAAASTPATRESKESPNE